VKGIEPSSKAWEAFVLPLNYTRMARILHGWAGWRVKARGMSVRSGVVHSA
jgi:hypothetical protein